MKVLVIYNKIWSYREIIFNLLSEEFDLTVSYSDPKYIGKQYNFKTIYLPVKKVGPFEIHTHNLHKIASQYDVVIGLSDIRWIKLVLLAFLKRKYKIGYWGIGVTASYTNKFDSKSTWDRVRFLVSKKSDFTIFYSSYPLNKYLNAGIKSTKLFVANNTTQVSYLDTDDSEKKDFLFIGTLYKQKGFEELLSAYYELYTKKKEIPNLLIIGDGPERLTIENFIIKNKIEEKVKLYGSIYDPKEISSIFNKCIACISPKQAGLSVLTSMGNKTCFVTEEDAITGGEIFSIENGVNGIIYSRDKNLVDIMGWIIENPDKVMEMNNNARSFYINNRTPEMMSNGIKRAIYSAIN